IPVDHLSCLPTVVNYFKKRKIGGKDTAIISPDVGGVPRARKVAERVDSSLAIISKRRPRPNVAEMSEIIGNVKGMKCMMIDDMIDTAGTLVKGAELLMNAGAREVSAYCTHGVLSGPAMDRIKTSVLKELIITDTIPLPKEKQDERIKVISVADVFGEAIIRAFEEKSISVLFLKK
ncbi:MAG TPA: ribose-phosphate diphosphokinase, partial [bacterium]|nr:ribose-phosphate diphosphokinase [bacterium]